MMKNISFCALIFVLTLQLSAQSEILIIGTMHDQPEGLPDNYAPILELVDRWNPELICTEYMLPNDTLSISKSYGETYFAKKDSIAEAWSIDLSHVDKEISKLYKLLEIENNIHKRMELRNLLFLSHDIGNARFQAYQIIQAFDLLSEQDQNNFKKSFPMYQEMLEYEQSSKNDEFTLLEFPLALKKDIKYLHPTDDQTLRDLYHTAWENAHKELKGSPILDQFESFVNNTKSQMGEFAQEGSTLLNLNNQKFQEILYRIEYSFIPAGVNVQKDLMNYYYMDRNYKMAQHILNVAKANPKQKIVVFYGVSHVPFINKILRAESNHRILTLPDIQ